MQLWILWAVREMLTKLMHFFDFLLPWSLLLTSLTLAYLSLCVTWQRTVTLLNASSGDLVMTPFSWCGWLNNLGSYMKECQHITSSCVKRLRLTIIPSAACLALLPEVITHLDLLVEQPVQIPLYYSKRKRSTKEFKMSRLILTAADLENLMLSSGMRSNLMGI